MAFRFCHFIQSCIYFLRAVQTAFFSKIAAAGILCAAGLQAQSSGLITGATDLVAGELANRNEESKTDLYYYVEYKPAVTGVEAKLHASYTVPYAPSPGQAHQHLSVLMPIASGTSSTGQPWLTSRILKASDEVIVNAAYRFRPYDTAPVDVYGEWQGTGSGLPDYGVPERMPADASTVKMAEEFAINRVYQLPAYVGTNVERYKLHFVVPEGFELYWRVGGSTGPFQAGSVLESTTFNTPPFDIVVMKRSEAGALPGKVTEADPGDGQLRLSLGFLSTGKSAGFLDFTPNLAYLPEPAGSTLGARFGRPPGAGDLRAVSLSDEVEVITNWVPPIDDSGIYQKGVAGIRQVVAPQALVDIQRDGFDLIVSFYPLHQRGSRITSENSPYAGAISYEPGKGPYAMTGTPLVSYRFAWSASVTNAPTTISSSLFNAHVAMQLTISRTEGASERSSSFSVKDYFKIIPEREDYVPCGSCGASGESPCPECGGVGGRECFDCGGSGEATCSSCYGAGSIDAGSGTVDCNPCNNRGSVPCETCFISGWVPCIFSVECAECYGSGSVWDQNAAPAKIDEAYPQARVIAADGFGSKFTSISETILSGAYFPEGDLPSGWFYGIANSRGTFLTTESPSAFSQRFYEGGFPGFAQVAMGSVSIAAGPPMFLFSVGTQKLNEIKDTSLKTSFGYYRVARSEVSHDTHHGRMKWRKDSDGGWQMFDYSSDIASLGQVTKTVSPYLDTEMPAELPSGASAANYRITTSTYTYDWDGVKRLPDTVTETANGIQVGYTNYDYSTGSANGQPLWITTTQTYTASGAPLTSVSKLYQGANVATWLRGLPYASEGSDGSKETVAYHRGSYNSSTKTFTPGIAAADLGFRSVVIKGTNNSSSGGAAVSSYDGTTIDSIYLTPNQSVAEVTIRDHRAFTVRSETRLYTGGTSWVLIDASDMEYDVAGNLIRREKLNGALYQATYTNENGTSESFGSINFNNTGTRTGQKEYERDEQGMITKFVYDSKGRVDRTIRLALPSSTAAPDGIPAITTVFTYDDENRVLSTTIKGASPAEDIVSSKTYDRSGRVLTETNQGLTTSYTYHVTDGILTSTTVTLPGGATQNTTTYRDGRTKAVTGTAGPATYYTYSVDGAGREITTTRIGSENSPRWSATTTDWAGRTVKTDTSSHDGSAPATLTSTSEYNAQGQLARSVSGGLAATLYSYDGRGVMTQYGLDLDASNTLGGTTDRINRFTYGYRQDGNVWSRYGGDTSTWWDYSETFAYPEGETTGQTLTKTWSRVTNFNKVSRPPGVVGTAIAEAVAADVHGNRAVTQTFLDRATGTMTTVVFSPFAAQPSITVAVAGRVVSQTSSAGVTTSFKYDSLGRPVKSIDRTSSAFGGNNVVYHPGTTRIQSITDNRNVRQHYYTYDSAGRVTSDQTPRIHATNGTTIGYNTSYFAYDVRGQLTHIWGDVPYPVQYGYNNYGDRTEQRTYRDTGTNWSASTWPGSGGDLTSFVYFDETGLLKTKTDAANKSVNYTYNTRGQLKTRTWSRGLVTSYTYFSGTGSLHKAEYTDGTPTIEYTYDRLGRTKTIKDATGTRTIAYRTVDLKPEAELFGRDGSTAVSHLLGSIRQLTYQYETGTGRILGADFSNSGAVEQSATYGYDPVSGRLKSISSGAGVFQYSYLANSNLISGVTRGSFTQSRSYEANRNNLDTLSSSTQAGTLAGYDYTSDDLGRRMSVEQFGQLYAPYVAVNQIMKTAYGYNERNEVTSSVTSTGASGSLAPLSGRNFGYDFDPIGNRTKEKFEGVEHAYTADALNRYTSRVTPSYLPVSGTANNTGGASLAINGSTLGSGSWRNNYFYTAVNKTSTGSGNLQSIGFSATSGGNTQTETAYSLTRPTTESFTYDDDGNLTADSLWLYQYDGENRLKGMYARVADQTGFKAAVLFINDYMGRRASKIVWNNAGSAESPTLASRRSVTYFAWQGWSLAAEYDGNLSTGAIGSLIRRFTFGVDLSGTIGGAGDIGGLLAIEDLRSGLTGTYLAMHDGNGNLTALADSATGQLAAEYEYDPFGNVLRSSGAYGKQNPFRFAGKYYDTETGLNYYGFRYYSASLGRFVNRDPLEERGGWNLYSGLKFGASNPLAGASGTDGSSWANGWEQAQDRQLKNVSLPHSTQTVTFGSGKNSGVPGSTDEDKKSYSANATGHYAQGGASGTGPQAPSLGAENPAAGNADINLYAYAGNDPINCLDAMGLATEKGMLKVFQKLNPELQERFLDRLGPSSIQLFTNGQRVSTYMDGNGKEYEIKNGDFGGGLQQDGTILVDASKTDQEAISSSFHEGVHRKQREERTDKSMGYTPGDPDSLRNAMSERNLREKEAYREEAQFQIDAGWDGNFVQDGKMNTAAIDAHVDKTYTVPLERKAKAIKTEPSQETKSTPAPQSTKPAPTAKKKEKPRDKLIKSDQPRYKAQGNPIRSSSFKRK